MTKTMFCGECEKRVPFEVRTVSERFEVRGELFTVEGPAHVCTSCGSVRGDSLFDALLGQAYEAYRKRNQVLSAVEIRGIREKYGFSQVLFAKILGIGEATLQRYERGALPSVSLNGLLLRAKTLDGLGDLVRGAVPRLSEPEKAQALAVFGRQNTPENAGKMDAWCRYAGIDTLPVGKISSAGEVNPIADPADACLCSAA